MLLIIVAIIHLSHGAQQASLGYLGNLISQYWSYSLIEDGTLRSSWFSNVSEQTHGIDQWPGDFGKRELSLSNETAWMVCTISTCTAILQIGKPGIMLYKKTRINEYSVWPHLFFISVLSSL